MFILLFMLFAALGFALTGVFTFWKIEVWQQFYKFIVLYVSGFVGAFLIIFLTWFVFAMIEKNKKDPSKVRKLSKFCLLQGMEFIGLCVHYRVNVTGLEKLPTTHKFLLVCNHRSAFDPIIMAPVLRNFDIGFMTKKENYSIPLAKRFMPNLFYLPIDRSNLLSSLETMKEAADILERGVSSIAIYPEGTRQKEKIIGEFHEGCFNIAIKKDVPLVVAIIKGTEKIKRYYPFRSAKVTLKFVQVFEHDEIQNKTAKALSDEIHELMQNELEK